MKSVFVKRAVISSLLALVISSSSQAATEQRISLFTSQTIGADFVLIPAGTFTMGDSANTHRVTVSRPFFMQTTEVTQGQWQTVMGSNPSRFKDCGGDCPVEQVSWNDVQDFIGKLNSIEGADKYRLPTEAEWEYAARSGGKQETYAGTSSESELGNYAWYSANSGRKTHPVGQRMANGLGLYDMSGNVWEWVIDWYGAYQSTLFSSLLSVTDPTGPSSGSQRVLRGGSWYNAALYCRAAFRRYYNPDVRSSNLGFRLVSTP